MAKKTKSLSEIIKEANDVLTVAAKTAAVKKELTSDAANLLVKVAEQLKITNTEISYDDLEKFVSSKSKK
jgi:hypothetical protein